jgi:hypothetical protein
MKRSPFLLLVPLLVATTAGTADAAPSFHMGVQKTTSSTCIAGNGTTYSQAGYWADPVALYPQTGDVEYVRGLAYNIGPCNDGASIAFVLPPGAVLATDVAPIKCFWGRIDGTMVVDLPEGPGCTQFPQALPNGGGLLAGAAALAPDQYLDVRVPVRYQQELIGSAAGGAHDLKVNVQTTWATASPVYPLNVGYRARLSSPTNVSIGSTTADLRFDLFTYFKGGTATVEFGTTAMYGSSTAPANVQAGFLSFQPTPQLTGLAPSTQYFWRARFTLPGGAYYVSPMQQFVTGAPQPVPLTVSFSGNGLGRVTSTPAGIDCGYASSNVCTMNVLPGTAVRLTPTPMPGNWFVEWTGACTGVGLCNVTVNQATSLTAHFTIFGPSPVPLPLPPPPSRTPR